MGSARALWSQAILRHWLPTSEAYSQRGPGRSQRIHVIYYCRTVIVSRLFPNRGNVADLLPSMVGFQDVRRRSHGNEVRVRLCLSTFSAQQWSQNLGKRCMCTL